MRLVYSIAIYLAFALLFPLLALHKKTRHGFWERFGFYRKGTIPSGGKPRIWLHGASAGDLQSLSPMIPHLRERFPGCTIMLSALTNSGYEMGKERIKGADAVVYVPWDLHGATRRAMRALKPDLLVLEYTEVWPHLIRAAKRFGAKVAMTNGRFSPAKMRSYRLGFALMGHPLRGIDLFLMRESEEAERALVLGAGNDRVWVSGNTKFDALLGPEKAVSGADELRAAFGFPAGAPIFLCGSTHEGEEGPLVDVFKKLLLRHPGLRLAIAPRYVDRAARIRSVVEAAGFNVKLRSEKPRSAEPPRVAILDTIGELARAYRLATLVFVGGSFTKRGGQNILEPAAQGKAVLFGPNMDNFHDSVQVLLGRGGIQVKDPDHLFRIADELLAKPEKLAELGGLAQSAVLQIRGASARNAGHMARLLGAKA